MQLIYSFDPERFYLGTLCKRGHRWPGTDLSLRNNFRKCLECEKKRESKKNRSDETRQRNKEKYLANLEENRRAARERMRARRDAMTPEELAEHRAKVCDANKERFRRQGRQSRAKGLDALVLPHGVSLSQMEARAARELTGEGHPMSWETLEPLVRQRVELILLVEKGLQSVGKCPSVARLVADEQKRYWKENPEAKAEHDRQWSKQLWWLKYQIDPRLRLYHREKSKRRKAQIQEVTSIKICPREIRDRFRQFGNCCAYCGCDGDMQIEHVVPIAQGGTHALGNIIPACQRCNTNKRDHDPEMWYRSQPFFSELRWKKICKVLGWDRSGPGQLALL